MKVKNNYQSVLENELKKISELDYRPSLLLHACCAPCGSYILEYLQEYFHITVYFYNPNIYPESEYNRRLDELTKFLSEFKSDHKFNLIFEKYSPIEFTYCSAGLETEKEGGERCFKCYDLRLSRTAEKANELKYDYFTTTLSISPHKNSDKINELATALSDKLGVKYLQSDFKKKNGFKRSLELSLEYNLYRQDYCGCEFSINHEFSE